ncbi:hypothetical protein AB0M80_04085 [Amycolatopsis sp. NPDC051045]
MIVEDSAPPGALVVGRPTGATTDLVRTRGREAFSGGEPAQAPRRELGV